MTTETQRADDLARLANRNAATWWTQLAAARGNALIRRRGYFWVPGSLRAGLRIMVLRPDLDPAEIAEVTQLAGSWPTESRVTVEDPFNVLDLSGLGFTGKRLPVMLREPGRVTDMPLVAVSQVRTEAEVALVEKTVVDGFPLGRFTPYQQSEALPYSLSGHPGITFFLARRDGEPAGACTTVNDGVVGGLYWVATLPEHRSHGVGRALMTAALDHLNQLGDLPATLTATAAGEPLYASMDFRTIAEATWWWPVTS